MQMTFSIADAPIVVPPGALSRSIVEGQFSILEAQILNGGRQIIHSGHAIVKNLRWIKSGTMFLKLLSIIIEPFFRRGLEDRIALLASLGAHFSKIFLHNRCRVTFGTFWHFAFATKHVVAGSRLAGLRLSTPNFDPSDVISIAHQSEL